MMSGRTAIHDTLKQFGALNQDAIDNNALLDKVGKSCPCGAASREKSSGCRRGDDRDLSPAMARPGKGPTPDMGS